MTQENPSDPDFYEKEYDGFIKNLSNFHQQRGTAFKKLPKINGKGVDLYLLYVVVTGKGGWQKVNARNEWEEILEDFRLPPSCTNSAVALKQIYMRYLDNYERINFLEKEGDDKNMDNDDDDSSHHRGKKSVRALNVVPLTYNSRQHDVSDSLRVGAGMCMNRHKASQYDRLCLSLLSPLSNEHDFSFNLCTLLSNEGKQVMHLSQCPRLLEVMLAHAGVFRDVSTMQYFSSNIKNHKSGKNLVQFWIDSVSDIPVLELLVPPPPKSKSIDCGTVVVSSEKELPANETVQEVATVPSTEVAVVKEKTKLSDSEVIIKVRKGLEMEDDLSECSVYHSLFHSHKDSSMLDSEGTRLSQIIHILRNLSFEEDNVVSLARSNTCIRFLTLCICSNYGGLGIQALDILGNIGHEVSLCATEDISHHLLRTVGRGVFSEDRAKVLRSLECLNKLAACDSNEEYMSNNIGHEVYEQICRYLTIHDIMLLIYTLESLYSLSSLGPASCNAIVRAQGAIHTLMALLTVEAQSYGPEACIGMKVVETVTGIVSDDTSTSTAQQTATASNASTSHAQTPTVTQTPHHLYTPQKIAPQHISSPAPILSSVVSTPTLAHHNNSVNNLNNSHAKVIPKNLLDMKKSVMSTKIPPELEEVICDFIRRSYESCPGALIEQAIVFRHFTSAMHAMGKKVGFNPVMLSTCFKKVYGFKVGPTRRNPKDASDKWYYSDIRRREVPLPIKPSDKINRSMVLNSPLAPSPIQSQVSGSSILKAQLSAPLRPLSPTPNKLMHSPGGGSLPSPPPVYSPRAPHSPTPPPHTPGRQENSALVKSLLANKVSRNIQKNQQIQLQQTGIPNQQLVTIAEGTNGSVTRTNGVSNENKSEEDSCNSLASILGQDNRKVTSFEGILQNGVNTSEGLQHNTVNTLNNNANSVKKNVLADLLEKTVGEDILNGVVDKEFSLEERLTNGPTTLLNNNQGVKRPSTDDFEDSGTKRLAIDRGDGKITLYVSQNGGEAISEGNNHQGMQQAPQQVVLSSGAQQRIVVTSNQQVFGGQQIIGTPSGGQQILTTTIAGQKVVSSVPGQQHILAPGQQIITTPQGQQIITSGIGQQIITSGGQHLVASSGPLISASGQLVGGGGQLVAASGGQIMTTANGQKVMVQGNIGQMIGGQVVLSQGNHIMMGGGNTEPTTMLVGGQLLQQGGQILQSAPGHQIVTASGQVIQQSPTPQIINTNQNEVQTTPSSQIVTAGGQVLTQGNQLVQQGGNTFLVQQPGPGGGKTLIILPPGQKVVPQGQMVQMVNNTTKVPIPPQAQTPLRTTTPQNSSPVVTSTPHVPAPQILASGIVRRQTNAPPAPTPPPPPTVQATGVGVHSIPPKPGGLQFVCEWKGCSCIFSTSQQLYHHACKVHCAPHLVEISCQWAGCEPMVRKRFSAMTHLHDRHCNEQLLNIHAVRRQQISLSGKTDIPAPQVPPPHPGYAPNAAFHAIKRHSLEVINHRDMVEKEGPVTKSIRLTSALILRNLVIYSNLGRKLLRGYESELCNVAISTLESSRTVAQILHDIHLADQ